MTETRLAEPADSNALADVHVSSWQKAYQGILPAAFLEGMDRGARARFWHRRLAIGEVVHVVGDPVVGFCYAGDSEDEGWGEVFAIYVRPDHWGIGMGRALLEAGESQLRDSGHVRALLWVLRDNHGARSFYERLGWVVGERFRVEEIGGAQVTEVRYEIGL